MGDYDRIIFCPDCMTRQNFNFSGSGKVGICMVCSYELARFSDKIVQSLGALAFDEYQSERLLKRRLSKELYNILHREV